jgi:hypothetical protein
MCGLVVFRDGSGNGRDVTDLRSSVTAARDPAIRPTLQGVNANICVPDVCIANRMPEDAHLTASRLRKGTGADKSASGATRVAGTVNHKRKYEPEFPTVRIEEAHPGRTVTKAQLEGRGLEPHRSPTLSQLQRHQGRGRPVRASIVTAPAKRGRIMPSRSPARRRAATQRT